MRIYVEFDSLEEFQAYGSGGVRPLVALPVNGAVRLSDAPADPTVVEATPQRRKRRTNAEIAAAQATAPPAEATTAQTSEFDDAPTAADDEFDTPVPTKAWNDVKEGRDLVRAALVGYQDRLVAAGKDIESARTVVMALLKKVGGADKLGALAEDKFAASIAAANSAK